MATTLDPNTLRRYAEMLQQAPSLEIIAENIRLCAEEWYYDKLRADAAEKRLRELGVVMQSHVDFKVTIV